jgi:hypothetical protein
MGSIVAAATRADGSVVLADASGRLAVSDAAGRRFQLAPIKPAMPLTGLVDAGDGRLALVGLRGAALSEALPR